VTTAPIVLVPGFWLGAWAWDEVADLLRADGHEVVALTLPGLEAVGSDRASIRLDDHVEAILDAVRGLGAPAVVAVHSGAAVAGYAASDRVPDAISHLVYVDTGPPTGALDPDFADVEMPMPSLVELRENEPLDDLTDEQLETFARRAVPEPGGAIRDDPRLANPARLDVPSTVIATGFTPDEYREALEGGQDWLAGLGEIHALRWVHLPTSHWPMWSRPVDLARIIGEIAVR
jgi:pimeloyl-ACP methyl ester carboxylesterase